MSEILLRPMKAGEEEKRNDLAYASYVEYAAGDPNHRLAQRKNYGLLCRSDPRMRPECNRLLFVDGELASSITVYLWPIRFRGGEILAGLIGMVCTHPNHRRRGYIRMLMEDVKNFMRDSGAAVSWLYGKESVYGPCGYATFTDYSIADARDFLQPAAGVTMRPVELGRDYETVKNIYESWNAKTCGPVLRLDGDWKNRVLSEKSNYGGLDRYRIIEDNGRTLAYCDIMADELRTVGEFGAVDEQAAARALPVIAREVGGTIQFAFDSEKLEKSVALAGGKLGRKQSPNGMWLVLDGKKLGLDPKATHEQLTGLLKTERFVYYYADHF